MKLKLKEESTSEKMAKSYRLFRAQVDAIIELTNKANQDSSMDTDESQIARLIIDAGLPIISQQIQNLTNAIGDKINA